MQCGKKNSEGARLLTAQGGRMEQLDEAFFSPKGGRGRKARGNKWAKPGTTRFLWAAPKQLECGKGGEVECLRNAYCAVEACKF